LRFLIRHHHRNKNFNDNIHTDSGIHLRYKNKKVLFAYFLKSSLYFGIVFVQSQLSDSQKRKTNSRTNQIEF
jgi:hypothetical protein